MFMNPLHSLYKSTCVPLYVCVWSYAKWSRKVSSFTKSGSDIELVRILQQWTRNVNNYSEIIIDTESPTHAGLF